MEQEYAQGLEAVAVNEGTWVEVDVDSDGAFWVDMGRVGCVRIDRVDQTVTLYAKVDEDVDHNVQIDLASANGVLAYLKGHEHKAE